MVGEYAARSKKQIVMLKVSGEVITDLYKYVKASPIAAITPNIFKKARPLNFNGECIIINALPITFDQVQEGVVNLNYIVPNLRIGSNPIDATQPNSVRLDAGEKVIAEVLKGVWEMNGYTFWVLQSTQMDGEPLTEWFVNFRIQYRNGI